MVWWRVPKIMRANEAGKTVLVAESKPNKWRWSAQSKTWNQQNFQEQKEGISERKY